MTADLRVLHDVRKPSRFTLGEFQVDVDSLLMWRKGQEIKLTPKAGAVLRELATHFGRVVSRDELMESVWTNTCPTDDVLSHAIAELRRLFRDDSRNPKIIATVPRVGYRLLMEPQSIDPNSTSTEQASLPSRPRFGLSALITMTVVGGVIGAMIAVLVGQQQEESGAVAEQMSLPAPLAAALPLATTPAPERMPALSPDGDRVVYAARVDGRSDFDLFLAPTHGGGLTRITDTPGMNEMVPVWSKVDERIAYYRYESEGCTLVIHSLHGGRMRELDHCPRGAITFLDWSPDGKTIAITSSMSPEDGEEAPTSARILLIDVITGEIEPLEYESAQGEHDVQPKFSADGKYIAFRSGAFPRSVLKTVELASGDVKSLTEGGARFLGFDWAPDGKSIWYCSDQSGTPALWQADLNSGRTHLLETGCGQGMDVAVGHNVMAFETVSENSEIRTVFQDSSNPDELAIETLFQSTWNEDFGAYHPDGTQLVFVSNRTGSDQLWLGNPESGETYQLTQHQGLKLIRPQWSADGRSVYYVGRSRASEVPYQIEVASGITRKTDLGSASVRNVTLSPDGNFVVYEQLSDGVWQLWRKHLEDGDRLQLTTEGGHYPQVDPDNKFVYFTRLDRFGLWRIPLAGGEPEHLGQAIWFSNQEGWLIDSEYLWTVHGDDIDKAGLYRFDLNDLENYTQIFPFEDGGYWRLIDRNKATGAWLFSFEAPLQSDIMVSSDW